VNIERMLNNIRIRFGLDSKAGRTDLTPLYVLEGIAKVIAKTQPYNRMWCALLRFQLAPFFHDFVRGELGGFVPIDVIGEAVAQDVKRYFGGGDKTPTHLLVSFNSTLPAAFGKINTSAPVDRNSSIFAASSTAPTIKHGPP
jgi:hypothetical protein